jgi:ribonuclease BN (tRNA processing enzyme)
MSDSDRSPRSQRFTRRLLRFASWRQISILNLVLLALVCVLAAALIAIVTKPVTTMTRLETASVLDHDRIWTTLGTMSGPIPSPHRSQPANLLWNNDTAILIDAGDGAAEQIAKAGHSLREVNAVILSHLHIDHTGGLSAIVGMRYQQHIPGKLTIYGPPGTQRLVAGILVSQQPLVELDAAGNPQIAKLPPSEVAAIEVIGGAKFGIGGVKVTAIENSHYGFESGTKNAAAYQSLSLRFDIAVGVASALRNRSIVYTGDTGPSDAVEKLAQGADLLISEITDPDSELTSLKAERTDIPFFAYPVLRMHFTKQHLTADAVGKLAAAAGVGSLVLTHNPIPDNLIPQARAAIASHYNGPVVFANDLQNY